MLNLLLQAAGTAAAPAAEPTGPVAMLIKYLPFALIALVVYMFMLRPQAKKAKEAKDYRESLAKGMKIITVGGIQATIVDVMADGLLIDSAGTRLKVDRTAISSEASRMLNTPAATKKA